MNKRRNLTQFRLLEESAKDVRNRFQRQFGVDFPLPVPVERIARDLLGLKLEFRNLGLLNKGLSGLFLREANLILINEYEERIRTRFKIAHEIGHATLIRMDQNALNHPKEWESSEDKQRILEKTYERFAGALLIPCDLLKVQIAPYEVLEVTAIRELAKTFDVSITAMLLRLEYLLENLEPIERSIDLDALQYLRSILFKEDKGPNERKEIPQQITVNDYYPFSSHQDSFKYSEVTWHINNVLMKLGVFSSARSEDDQEGSQSPSEILKRPFVIEFAGTPKAGKDTQIEILAEYLRDIRGYRVKVMDEGYRSCEIQSSEEIHVNKFYWTLGTTVTKLIEILDQPPKYDVVIFNRGLFDALAFLLFYEKQHWLTKKEKRNHVAFLTTRRLLKLVDVVFLLNIPPEESLNREKQRSRRTLSALAMEYDVMSIPTPPQNLMNEDGIRILNECYDAVFQECKEKKLFKNMYQLQSNANIPIETTSKELVEKIHAQLPSRLYRPKDGTLMRQSKTNPGSEMESEVQLSLLDLLGMGNSIY